MNYPLFAVLNYKSVVILWLIGQKVCVKTLITLVNI